MSLSRIGSLATRSTLSGWIALLISFAAMADEPLTEPQRALFKALDARTASDGAGPDRGRETEENLKRLLTEWLAAQYSAPQGYQFARREVALDGIPGDGLPHRVRVARDIFVLQGDEQVYAFRRVVECAGSSATDGPMQGVPRIVCDDAN